MVEIIDFINDKGKLTSPPILEEFIEKYPNQNKGLLGEDVLKWVRFYNDNCSLVEDKNVLIRTDGVLMYVMNGSHMFYLYKNDEEGYVEKWDPSTWQQTTNNCSLYAALVAIIRPITSFEKTKELIKKVLDSRGSSTCKKLAEISQHFFNRGIDCFNYPIITPFSGFKNNSHHFINGGYINNDNINNTANAYNIKQFQLHCSDAI